MEPTLRTPACGLQTTNGCWIGSERLGHSTVALTPDTYSHLLPGVQEQAAGPVDAVLRAAMNKGRWCMN